MGLEAGKPGAQDAPEGYVRFNHGNHVPSAWTNPDVPERQRDCRGCHNYSVEGPHDPQAVCINCHFSDEVNQYEFKLWAVDPSFLTGLSAVRSQDSLFQHSYHLALECRECHPAGDDIRAPYLMPKSGGLALCEQCHIGEKPRQEDLRFMATRRDGTPIDADYGAQIKGKLMRGLVEALNGAPAMGPNAGAERHVGPFRHQDHILPEHSGSATSLSQLMNADKGAERARRANCAACHGPMFDAVAGMTPPEGSETHVSFEQTAENCGACHISDGAGTPISFRVEASTKPSLAAATFSHADHLRIGRPSGEAVKATAAGYESIHEEGCFACHEHDAAAAGSYVLSDGLGSEQAFQGCQECHSTSAWAPVEHGDWWTHEDHGSWQSCTPCHDFAQPDFLANRPLVQVERRRPGVFRIETQMHPHITTAPGESIEQSCAECHRQPVAELPSRIQEAPFRHASHLPAEPSAEDCLRCHGPNVSLAEFSGDLGRRLAQGGVLAAAPEAQVGLVYDPASCTECHLGAAPVASSEGSEAALTPREVPEFSHGAHVGKPLANGEMMGCAECHVFDPGGQMAGESGAEMAAAPIEIRTVAEAMDCTLCHDHSWTPPAAAAAGGDTSSWPARALVTGAGITPAEVQACTLCHVSGIPVDGAEWTIPSAMVADLAGNAGQFHPDDRECATCHIPREGLIAAASTSVPSGSRVFVQRSFYVPEIAEGAKPAIHRGGTRKIEDDYVSCADCHWTKYKADSIGEGTGTTNPETPLERRKRGDDLRYFPGGNPDKLRR